ncbi:MAG: hypothetical protein HYY52_04630 [Candidatus Melainabacteria bacterium]|nr:hypothetical protein [Candidatus Melainabacteria bacterium]
MQYFKFKNLKLKLLSLLFQLCLLITCFPSYAEDINYDFSDSESKPVVSPVLNEDNDLKDDSAIINPDNPKILKGHVSKIPGGTKVKIIIETPIDEITSMVEDEIKARISENIIVDEKIVVPISSAVTGKISEINVARRLHMAGNVRIEFQGLTIPDGRKIPISASVLTHSGLLKGKFTKKTALISSATIVGPAAAGFGAGLAAEGSAVGATVGAIVGAVAGIALFAFQRGNMVDIKAGDELNIELTEEALVPEPEPEVQSENEKLEDEKLEN